MLSNHSDIRRGDFAREVVLDCFKDGTIVYRNRVDALPKGALPFFSVHNGEEAQALIVRLCKRGYGPNPGYKIAGFGSEQDPMTGLRLLSVADIDALADRFRSAWFDMRERGQGELA